MLNPPVVLAYHGIADVRPTHDPVRLFVPPEQLAGNVRRLQARGYGFLKISDFAERLSAGEDLRQTCALTFDDGTEDHYSVLPDVLRSLGVPGSVYVCRNLMGEPYPWSAPESGVRLMTAEQAVELARDPLIELGSHTNDHTVLADASEDEAYKVMVASKETLEDLLQVEMKSFCYPRCFFSAGCPAAAERAGHTNAVTCGPRGDWSPFTLRRESMHTPDGPVTFEVKTRGLYRGLVDMPPARFARWATRAFRHRAERRDGSGPGR